MSNWRQFPFFEGLSIKDPYLESPNALYSNPTLSASCAADDKIAIAVNQTEIKLINEDIQETLSFQCYESGWTITNIKYFSSILVTFAERQGYPSTMKLWNLSKVEEKIKNNKFDFNSSFISLCQISNGSNNYPLTCWDIAKDHSMFIFGFSNGSVILVRGDLIHDRGSRQRIIYESNDPVVYVGFKDLSTLFVTTFTKTFTLSTSGKNQRQIEKLLDDEGADIGCTCMYKESLIVARNSGFQLYTVKGKSTLINIEMPKKQCYVYQDRYIVCLSQPTTQIPESAGFSNQKLLIFDTKYNFIVYNHAIQSSIMNFIKCWDDLYVFLLDGSLLRLHEKSAKDNIDILVNNEQFHMAVKLASENPSDFSETEMMELRRRYALFLYKKGEFQDSIDQFIECIPLEKSSEVIVMFKDSSKIPHLTKYLEKMLKLKLSTSNHINLLLTSYCKLKEFHRFREFICNVQVDEDFDFKEKHQIFDLESIIQLCIDNEYFELALMVAKKFNSSSKVVSIQLNDMNDPNLTLSYIKSLQIDDLLRVLVENVNELLDMLPNETTQLLIDVFTGKYQPTETIKEDVSDVKSIVSYPLFTSYKQFASFMSMSSDEELDLVQSPTYQPPRPQIIFPSFMRHNYEFVIFLEACIESYDKFGGNPKDKNDISNTLYELYLTLSQEGDENTIEWEEKAKSLLLERNEWSEEDKTSLLLISNIHGFEEGEAIIQKLTNKNNESLDKYEMNLFRSAILTNNMDKSFDIVMQYGEKEPELYKLALITYTSTNQCLDLIGEEKIQEILGKIEKQNCFLPLEVIDCMTKGTANVKLGLVKDYILRNIQTQRAEIEKNEKLMLAYESKLDDLTNQIDNLLNNPQQIKAKTCSICSNKLYFPIVYFKCGHQVHESCLVDKSSSLDLMKNDSTQCTICAAEQDAMVMLKQQQVEMANRQDLFKSNLESSTDKFKAMFSFLGRGGLEPTKVVVNHK